MLGIVGSDCDVLHVIRVPNSKSPSSTDGALGIECAVDVLNLDIVRSGDVLHGVALISPTTNVNRVEQNVGFSIYVDVALHYRTGCNMGIRIATVGRPDIESGPIPEP